jgi:hypothetical protein
VEESELLDEGVADEILEPVTLQQQVKCTSSSVHNLLHEPSKETWPGWLGATLD